MQTRPPAPAPHGSTGLVRLGLAAGLALGLGGLGSGPALAHTPLCACYDNGDGTILCEGGFSDGSSAAGVKMTVTDAGGALLLEGVMSDNSEFVFDKPEGAYAVHFEAGEGHSIVIDSQDIF